MNTNYSNCICQTIGSIDYAELPKRLREVWEQCPALNKAFIPNEETLEALIQRSQTPDEAHHCSISWRALEEGYLNNIMGPVHRYLLEGENFCKDTTRDYKKRFHETWIIKNTDAFKRHETAKKQSGSLYELVYANYLEEQGHQIISLEAWGGPADISARINGEEYDIEVKAIGPSKDEFSAVYKTLKNPDDPPYVRSNPMEPVKYLTEIIRNATIQIEKLRSNRKKRLIIIDNSISQFPIFYSKPYKPSKADSWDETLWSEKETTKAFNEIVILDRKEFVLEERYRSINPNQR